MSATVEAAAKAATDFDARNGRWDEKPEAWKAYTRDQLRASLEAALPHLVEGLAEVIARHNQCIDWGTQDYEGACWGCDWEGEPGDFESHLAAIIAEELKRRIEG